MSKRQAASLLMFGKKKALKYPAKVVAGLSGTGTVAAYGVINFIAASGVAANAGRAYLTVSSGTNIGTLVGTGR
jgi:hypothetical protein